MVIFYALSFIVVVCLLMMCRKAVLNDIEKSKQEELVWIALGDKLEKIITDEDRILNINRLNEDITSYLNDDEFRNWWTENCLEMYKNQQWDYLLEEVIIKRYNP